MLVVIWAVASYFLIFNPSVDKPHRVDAILVLGPPDKAGALDKAIDLVKEGYSKNLVVSLPQTYFDRATCADGVPGAAVTCFFPDPSTTRGESEHIGRLAHAKGWTSLMVVTGKYHVARSRTLVDRCFHGRTLMIGADKAVSASTWRYEFFYESGAWLKAIVHRSC